MKRYWLGIFGYTKAGFKRFFRDKTALFFTFLFPLIFLFIFGSIFNNKEVNFKVALINHSENELAQKIVALVKDERNSIFKIDKTSDLEEAKLKLKRDQIDGIIEIPKEFGNKDALNRPSGVIKAIYAKGSDQAGSLLAATIGANVAIINKNLGQSEEPIKIMPEAMGDEALKPFDYTFTGLIAFTLMSMGIFGLANALPTEKKQGVFRRIKAGPFSAGQLIIATAIIYVTVAIISMATMLVFGIVFFEFQMRGNWLLFGLLALLGSTMMTGVGLAIGGWAQNDNQSAPISNLVSMPMMFLSGTFFPTFLFPEWLQAFTQFVPISPLVKSLRMVMAENAGIGDLGMEFGLILVWIVIIYIIAIKCFRWE